MLNALYVIWKHVSFLYRPSRLRTWTDTSAPLFHLENALSATKNSTGCSDETETLVVNYSLTVSGIHCHDSRSAVTIKREQKTYFHHKIYVKLAYSAFESLEGIINALETQKSKLQNQ